MAGVRDATTATNGGPVNSDRPVVEAIKVSKRYGSTVALDDVSLTIASGQTHALVGRNGAGKSTLVSLITGLQPADSGTVQFAGQAAPSLADRDAWRERVACVFQKSTIIPSLTVAENLCLNRQPVRRGLIDWISLRRIAREKLAEWEVDVDVRSSAGDLTVEQRQLVEIARALSFGARFVILDEPTARLDGSAIGRLFDRIGRLQQQGVTFLFISHHLQEVYEICDVVTVFRDARQIITKPVSGLPKDALVTAMTGEDSLLAATPTSRRHRVSGADALLTVENLDDGASYRDVSFSLGPGEVVGLAGSAGSGKVGVAERIVGLRSSEGMVRISGKEPKRGSVPAALRAGVGLVPQDRHQQGFVGSMSIADNITMTIPRRLGRGGFIDPRRRDRVARRLIEELTIKTPGPTLPVESLSGGNQQKVVMARALASEPKVLVLITPTAGVDVRSKETLLEIVDRISRDGAAVLIVSDEIDDLRACDRVIVMFQGRIVKQIKSGWADVDVVAAMEGIQDV